MNQPPCKNCITLSICTANAIDICGLIVERCARYYPNHSDALVKEIYIARRSYIFSLMNKCSLIKQYCIKEILHKDTGVYIGCTYDTTRVEEAGKIIQPNVYKKIVERMEEYKKPKSPIS